MPDRDGAARYSRLKIRPYHLTDLSYRQAKRGAGTAGRKTMPYMLRIPDGPVWKIEEAHASHRWMLLLQRDASWHRVASYNSPGAAALAVACNETGINDWDNARHAPIPTSLQQWQHS